MSWGAQYMYYVCPKCGKKFKCAVDMIAELGDEFGMCPIDGEAGKLVADGARIPTDLEYEEVE